MISPSFPAARSSAASCATMRACCASMPMPCSRRCPKRDGAVARTPVAGADAATDGRASRGRPRQVEPCALGHSVGAVAIVTIAAVYEIRARPRSRQRPSRRPSRNGAGSDDGRYRCVPPAANAADSATHDSVAQSAAPPPTARRMRRRDTAVRKAGLRWATRRALNRSTPRWPSRFPGHVVGGGARRLGVLTHSHRASAGHQAVTARAVRRRAGQTPPRSTVTWQGKPFDTAPYTRQNVARFTLR